MYRLLLVMIVASAVSELKVEPKDFEGCRSRECIRRVDATFKRVLKIDWRPISVFPEEAKRFSPPKQ